MKRSAPDKSSRSRDVELNGELSLPFLRTNRRDPKPRAKGITEIRGPYYSPIGRRMLEDILETMGQWIDSFKFGGGAFALMPAVVVREIIETCHRYDVTVSTGGFVERIVAQGGLRAVEQYIDACKTLGFDTIEVSAGFISIPTDDLLEIVQMVQRAGLNAKPEIGIQFGAGGASSADKLEQQGTIDIDAAIAKAAQFLDAGAKLLMIESEGITECVKEWRTDIPAKFVNALGLDKVMFEAADPDVFSWYIKNFGPEVNLFVDHSQIRATRKPEKRHVGHHRNVGTDRDDVRAGVRDQKSEVKRRKSSSRRSDFVH